MIDEKQEALDYLDGKHIMADNMYRTCVMLARYYKDEGFGHAKIRSSIFDWANRYHLYIRHDLNAIITYVMSSPMPLVANTVKINQRDREFISRITDNPKTQLIALAMLCYAKVYSDKQKEFHISCVSLGAWIGIHRSQIKRRYIRELIDFGYLEELEKPRNNYTWANPQSTRYRILAPVHNSGDYKLVRNDIYKLYREVFSGCL